MNRPRGRCAYKRSIVLVTRTNAALFMRHTEPQSCSQSVALSTERATGPLIPETQPDCTSEKEGKLWVMPVVRSSMLIAVWHPAVVIAKYASSGSNRERKYVLHVCASERWLQVLEIAQYAK